MNAQDTTGEYTLGVTLPLAYVDAVPMVRLALAEQGFGILTEIDLAATMKAKLGKEIAPQVILGACRPQLAYQALRADPSLAALLPCNFVVRALDGGNSKVEAFDPEVMMSFSAGDAIAEVAADARQRLAAALEQLTSERFNPDTTNHKES